MASDSDGDEDFVSFGTPLEPLEEDEPLKKPIPLHEQTVKDEKGRYQRFHGAFTGGFSAGYFNTVGSKEGWTPSTFVSSRQQKAEKQQARPEDFMDEEDLGEHGIAPSRITTSHEFTSGRRDALREKARAVNAQAALIPGDTLLEELIAPARSSIGVELLMKMGWKEGQGVGPRVKRKARKQKTEGAGGRVYGCTLPPGGSEESEDDDDGEFAPQDVTFAPKDVTPVDFTPSTGLQGLGYCGLNPGLALMGGGASEHIDLFKPNVGIRDQLFGGSQPNSRRGGVAGQAFGIGAMEDDDDEEVYHKDSMSRYDTVLGGEEPGDGLYGWTAPQQYTKKKEKNNDASYLGKILEGFTLSQKPLEEKTIFPPPVLPRDYKPVHRLNPSLHVSHLSGVSPALAEALRTSRGHMVKEEPGQAGRHQLDSGQRRTLLGEDTLQGPSSVMELLRPEDRERLLNLRNSSKAPSAKMAVSMAVSAAANMAANLAANASGSRAAAASARSTTGSTSGSLTAPPAGSADGPTAGPLASAAGLSGQQQEALASWRGVQSSAQSFKPFEKNPSKQARYELYLNRLREGDKGALEQSLDSGMTEWERSREGEEFVRASILYRPTSSMLSSRFTRGKHEEDEDKVEVNAEQEGDLDDKQNAVKMKMFGKLTRETFEWHPDRLLCKRFNVPDPYPGSGLVGMLKVKRDKFSVFNFLTVTENREATAAPKPPDAGKKSRWDVSNQEEKKKKEEDEGEDMGKETPKQPETKALPSSASSDDKSQSAADQSSEKKKEGEEEEEEEEESRPPMDLFKAIFASSSDDKSSSSEGESEEEEDEGVKEDEGKVASQPLNLFNIPNITAASTSASTSSINTSSTSASTSSTSASNQQPASAWSSSSSQEFGPKLPPPSAALRGAASDRCPREEERPARTSKEKKHKNKKQHKHKKDKKKKKQKKHKHKTKQQKKSKEATESSDDDDSEESDPQVSTEELLKRLKSVQSQQKL